MWHQSTAAEGKVDGTYKVTNTANDNCYDGWGMMQIGVLGVKCNARSRIHGTGATLVQHVLGVRDATRR